MLNELLDRITGILAATTVSIIALSWCHEYGYFLSVGRYFQSLLTASDYFANAIFYLPFAVFIAYTWIDWPIIRSPAWPIRQNRKTWVFPILILGVFPMLWLFFGSFYFLSLLGISASAGYAWALQFNKLFPLPTGEDQNVLKGLRHIGLFGMPILGMMCMVGFVDGNNDLRRFSDPYVLQMKSDARPTLRIMLRRVRCSLTIYASWPNQMVIANHNPAKMRNLTPSMFAISDSSRHGSGIRSI